ncbi:protein ENHANCED DISEASE RESISTANCE 4-like isoform X2 [Tripterygium wilfordii]|uniref:protein ENHANCED DISEASE RESISTANCE 4-like isoform X2 n=1 Tax=Tripterygium wilfordii TaxID=458696 RepID=UPI0018F7EE8B|nr:protein ENHANCED DISEASE RESISTANCE 4-like isoform X2 [Tripterygium wilfordii]
MTESTGLRLVRCPKCENLLPELADYSVYQCGGCGTVLRAKNSDADAFPSKSNEEGVAEASTRSQNSSDKGVVELSDTSDSEAKSSGSPLRCNENFPDKNNVGYTDRGGNQYKVLGNALGVENGLDVKLRGDEPGNVVEREHGNLNSTMEDGGDSWRLGRMSNRHLGEKSEKEGFQRSMKRNAEGMRFSASNYPDEGPSNSRFDSLRNYGDSMRSHSHLDGANRVQYLEQNRAELLQKLDELKDQFIRTCDVADKPKEQFPGDGRAIPPHSYSDYNSRFPGISSGLDRAPMQYFRPDRHASGPPCFSHCPDPFPYANGHEMPIDSFYPPKLKSSSIPGRGDPFGSQMFRRAPQQLSSHYQQQQPHPHFSGRYVDPNPDLFEPYPHNEPFHQPSCPCLLCYNKNQRVSAPVLPTAFGNKRFPDIPYDPMSYHRNTSAIFGPPFQNSSTENAPMNFHAHRTHSEMDGTVRHRLQKLVFASNDRRCYPVAGAAPFIACYNCFELLQLPKKAQLLMKSQQKIRCGACSTVINFTIIDGKVVLSVDTMQNPSLVDDTCNELVKDHVNSGGRANQFSADFSSDDFQMMDRKPILMSRVQDPDSRKPQDMHTFRSSSLTTSDDENSPEFLTSPTEVINSVQRPIKTSLSLSAPDSPLQDPVIYSANNHSVNRFGKGNQSSRSDQEKDVINKATVRQNSMKETSFATEMEVSFNELSSTGVSQNSGDADREDEKSRINKSGESFFMNIIKKRFRDLSKSNPTDERGNVSINGHLIPEHLVKKAEKRAGPIHPGEYWYDSRAGFWGVIGGPCLGIIPKIVRVETLVFL